MKNIVLLCFLCITLFSAADEKIKTGYNLGVLPAISYNTDEGFQYGAVFNLFNYGKTHQYPQYDQSYYFEFSKYTKGSTVLRFYFDSDKLLKGVRTFADVSYIAEDMLDFYGYNGYKSCYNPEETDRNRAFYRMSQKQVRFIADLKGKLPVSHLYWEASVNAVQYRVRPVDYNKLNNNTDYNPVTPGESLFEKYRQWGIIDAAEAQGGWIRSVKAGVVYDTRNLQNNPDKGFCTEALLEMAPAFANEQPYTRYSVFHRQYKSLVENRLNLAVRIGAQGKIGSHKVPFYRMPVLMSPFAVRTSPTALGGTNSLRGILRNRILGNSFALGNFELRWKACTFRLINQNFYLGINGFYDTGIVLDPVDWNLDNIDEEGKSRYFNLEGKDRFHSSLGGGLKAVMNQNFIVSFETGKPLDARDGDGICTYINLNYLF